MLSNKGLVNKLHCIQVATIRHFSRKYLSIHNVSIINDGVGEGKKTQHIKHNPVRGGRNKPCMASGAWEDMHESVYKDVQFSG